MNKKNTTSKQGKKKAQKYVCTAIDFELGACVMTRGIHCLLLDHFGASLHPYLIRHKSGDWGDMPIEDKRLNDEATKSGGRIISGYEFCGEKIWIITEADRSVTTVLFPSEY